MGLFDDDNDYVPPKPPQPSKPSRREMLREGRERDSGPSRGDMFKHEFGLHGWTAKNFMAVGLVLVVLAIVFVVKFGTNPTSIVACLHSRLGMNSQMEVVSAQSASQLTVNPTGCQSAGTQTASLIGVSEVRCTLHAERQLVSTSVDPKDVVSFSTRDKSGHLQVSIQSPHGQDLASVLLSDGLVRLNGPQANASGQGAALRAAQASAIRHRRGIWGHGCRA